tara:strand:- start:351 stop:821 length:471 start_codon:yes stop_codon:yes gene_type:complete
MAKKSAVILGIAVAVVAISIAYGAIANPGGEEKTPEKQVWDIRISGSEFHDLQVFGSKIGTLGIGTYEFGFVPMGDSPQFLRLTISNENAIQVFSEEFTLEQSLVDTGVSKYYTWDYLGNEFVSISERGDYEITIEREGNLKGSVSISLTKLDRSI